jgi:hypothetical protein
MTLMKNCSSAGSWKDFIPDLYFHYMIDLPVQQNDYQQNGKKLNQACNYTECVQGINAPDNINPTPRTKS